MMAVIHFVQSLQWRDSTMLWLACLPVLVYLLRRICRHDRLEQYADKHLHYWVVINKKIPVSRKLFSPTTAYLLAWLLFSIAAAGPRMLIDIDGDEKSAMQDIYLVVDVSRSMHATDAEPNRLKRARIELYDLLSRATNNRIGIIIYTASAHILAPLSYDANMLKYYLSRIDDISMPAYGTNHVNALRLAQKELQQTGKASSIIWITDGDIEQQYTIPLSELAVSLAEAKIPLFILNAGTIEGDAIPLDKGGWLGADGQVVLSRSNIALLKKLAETTGGAVSDIYDDDTDWERLYNQGVLVRAGLPAPKETARTTSWVEYYGYTLLPGLLLLFFASLPYPVLSLLPRRVAVLLFACVLSFSFSGEDVYADGLSSQRAAHDNFSKGDYATALRQYEKVSGYHGRFGQGASAYRLGDNSVAINQFTQAVLQAEDDGQRISALYNLGNAYFNLGDYAASIRVYADVLQYRPEQINAKRNLSLSMKLQQDVELRLQQRRAKAARIGRGPSSQAANQDIEIPDFGVVSLDDSENDSGAGEKTIASIYEKLLDKGVEYADLATTSVEGTDNYTQSQSFVDAQSNMQRLGNQYQLLWKRIIEIEAGFAAPQDKPSSVSGVKPW
jgi:Ca-activated chloride channel family protein